MPLAPSFHDFVNGGKVCAPSNVHIQEADAIVQHNPCSNAAGQRGRSVEEAPWFSSLLTIKQQLSTQLHLQPANFFPSQIVWSKKYYKAVLKYTCFNSCHFLFSSQNPVQNPYGHRPSGSGVRGLKGRLWKSSARKARGLFKSSKCLQPSSQPQPHCWLPHNHGKSHLKSITYILWGQRDKQQDHRNTDLSCWSCQQGGTLH